MFTKDKRSIFEDILRDLKLTNVEIETERSPFIQVF